MARKRNRPKTSAPVPSGPRYEPDWTILGLAGAGLLVTGYLVLVGLLNAAPVGCTAGSACDIVQQSRWSTLLGLPVALWGFGLYLVMALVAGLGRARLKRWRTLWFLSFFGLIFSLYLTLVAWFELQALCAWCSVSLLILAAIFGILSFARPESAPGMPWSGFLAGQGAILLVLMLGVHAIYAGWFEPPEDPRLRALAEHLDRVGAVYYGASWCPTCQEQNRMFGPAYRHLPYVECSPQGREGPVAFECVANEIVSYPTWVIGNRRLTEPQTPEDLARYSRFNWAAWSE
ncbi:MAG: vitamin K epoxide reductase family protein [Wenzhouxiangella sp.]|nr:MAG: vitamin K epoxide reductase family protein [Wenzhouxiangella sp.]